MNAPLPRTSRLVHFGMHLSPFNGSRVSHHRPGDDDPCGQDGEVCRIGQNFVIHRLDPSLPLVTGNYRIATPAIESFL
jgi:hypothetical protein